MGENKKLRRDEILRKMQFRNQVKYPEVFEQKVIFAFKDSPEIQDVVAMLGNGDQSLGNFLDKYAKYYFPNQEIIEATSLEDLKAEAGINKSYCDLAEEWSDIHTKKLFKGGIEKYLKQCAANESKEPLKVCYPKGEISYPEDFKNSVLSALANESAELLSKVRTMLESGDEELKVLLEERANSGLSNEDVLAAKSLYSLKNMAVENEIFSALYEDLQEILINKGIKELVDELEVLSRKKGANVIDPENGMGI